MFNRHFGELRLLDYSGATTLCGCCFTLHDYPKQKFATFICHRFVTHLASKLGAQKMEDESDEFIFDYKSETNLALNYHPLPENQLQAITSRTP
jgi:hypothetical protein